MTPIYRDHLVTLYHADAFDPESIPLWTAADVLFTDPPYGLAYTSGRGGSSRNQPRSKPIAGDRDTEARDRALALWGPDRAAVVFGTWRTPRPEGVRQRLIWDKGWHGMGDFTFPWGPADEEIYVLGDGFAGTRRANIYRQNTVPIPDRTGHPTPKPVPLIRAILDYCPPGIVADPFAGSGSTLIAARDSGRPAIGFEIDAEYAEEARQRLARTMVALF